MNFSLFLYKPPYIYMDMCSSTVSFTSGRHSLTHGISPTERPYFFLPRNVFHSHHSDSTNMLMKPGITSHVVSDQGHVKSREGSTIPKPMISAANRSAMLRRLMALSSMER